MAFSRTLQHFTSSQELATIWASGQSYIVNQLVLNNNLIYRCLIANTSSLSFSTDLGAGKWVEVSASASGTKNYISNSNFEQNTTTGWSLFNTTLTSKIPTGSITAGAASITSFAVDSTTPIAGTYDLRVASSGALTAGQGFISDAFTIDREDQAKPLAFSFAYEAVSGTMNFSGTSNNTFAVYIYDVSGSAWIQPAGVYNLVQSSGVGIASGTFQTTATGTQYRIAVVCITATAGAVEMRFDSFQLGPQGTVQGAPVTDWVSARAVPALVGSTTNPTTSSSAVKYRRIGDSYEISWYYGISTAGSGEYRLQIPDGLTIDTAKLAQAYAVNTGAGRFYDSSTGMNYNLTSRINLNSTTYINLNADGFAGGGVVGSALPVAVASGDEIWATVILPIAGLSSSVQMSNDTDTRVVAMSASGVGGVVTANVTNIPTTTTTLDTHASWSGSVYTVPVSGSYQLFGSGAGPSNASFFAYIDGVSTYEVKVANGTNASGAISYVLPNLRAGQTISIRSNVSQTLTNFALAITRISGPATIAASETVAASAGSAAGGSLADTIFTYIDFPTSTINTHNAVLGAGSGNSATYTNTWRFIAPISGIYSVSANLTFVQAAATTTSLDFLTIVAKNGSSVLYGQRTLLPATLAGAPYGSNVSGLVRVNAGDAISIIGYQDNPGGTSRNLEANSAANYVSIVRVGN